MAVTNRILVIGETPSGDKDGLNTSFTLSNTPTDADDAGISFNGVRMARVSAAPGVTEYTLSGTALELGLAPNSTDSLFADYTT